MIQTKTFQFSCGAMVETAFYFPLIQVSYWEGNFDTQNAHPLRLGNIDRETANKFQHFMDPLQLIQFERLLKRTREKLDKQT